MAPYRAPKRPPLTHFLCIPLVTDASQPRLEASLAQFHDAVTTEHINSNGLHPKAVRPLGTLHLTLGVMSLDDAKLSRAIACLQDLDVSGLLEQASAQKVAFSPLVIDLIGLASMHPLRKTSILYVSPSDPTDRLYAFCTAVQNVFKEQRLLVEDERPLKLHATIVNTVYAKGDRSEGHGVNAKSPIKIDATAILRDFEKYVWAEGIVMERIAICEMGARKVVTEEGREAREKYTEVACLRLPA